MIRDRIDEVEEEIKKLVTDSLVIIEKAIAEEKMDEIFYAALSITEIIKEIWSLYNERDEEEAFFEEDEAFPEEDEEWFLEKDEEWFPEEDEEFLEEDEEFLEEDEEYDNE